MKILINSLLFLSFIIASFFSSGCGDNKVDDGPATVDTVPQEEEFPIDNNKTFVHPGLLHTQSDFDRVKMNVGAEMSPWLEGWEKLINNSHAQLTYTPNPVEKLIRGGNSAEEPLPDNYATAMNDVAAAYQCALRWKISGDVAYAEKAIQILNAWASTCKEISGNSNIDLAAGIYGYEFANAAEIMRSYDGWDKAGFEKFKRWMLDVFYPISSDFIVRHNGTCISHYWANWDLCSLANIMAIGVLTDSAAIYNEAINYLIHGKGNGQLKNTIYYIHPDGLGQLQESGRDQGHALLCIGLLGVICETAWNQGDDLYGYDDNRVLKGAEYAARYNFANLSVPFEPYNNCDNVDHTKISDAGRTNYRPIWEVLYNHYAKRKGIPVNYTELAAKIHRVEGGGGDYGSTSGGFDNLGFGTLMFSRN